jgi:hypothetical protein
LDTPSSPSSRDDGGRFASGNTGGPGRPRGRGNALRRAAEDAIAPEHITAILRRATRMALEGNMAAMRLVMERTCGRPFEAPATGMPVELELPQLRTAANCTFAIDKLAEAICKGTVDRDAAKILLEVIQTRLKAIEVTDLENRLAQLEQAAEAVARPE